MQDTQEPHSQFVQQRHPVPYCDVENHLLKIDKVEKFEFIKSKFMKSNSSFFFDLMKILFNEIRPFEIRHNEIRFHELRLRDFRVDFIDIAAD